MQPNGVAVMSPVAYPTVTIAGRTYTLEVSLLAQYKLDCWGVDTRKLGEIFKTEGPGKLELFMKLFSACVSHNFVAVGEEPPTPDQWAMRIPKDQWQQCCQATVDCMLKASPVATAPTSPETQPALN